MNVRELRAALEPHEGELTVFFRCIAPFVGNVREVDVVKKDTFSTFGEEDSCVILDIEREEEGLDPRTPEFGVGL